MSASACRCVCICVVVHVSKLEDNVQKSVLCFISIGPRNQTQTVGLGSKHLYLLSHLAGYVSFLLIPVMHQRHMRIKEQLKYDMGALSLRNRFSSI